jgi:DnaJ-class molecular chaperone
MPIRPENRARYPKDWKAISERIRFKRAKSRCECTGECGADHGRRCKARNGAPHPETLSKVVLTVAHLDHIPENCGDDNLKAMCQRCHNKYDAPKRRAGIVERQRLQMADGDLFASVPT